MYRNIRHRLDILEKEAYKMPLPVVSVDYKDGTTKTFRAFPDDLKNAIKAYGCDFAELVNVILHPVPNRNIEDLE